MIRYNLGLLKFGPMEQCTSGDWAKYKDLIKVLRLAIEMKNTEIAELRQRVQLLDKENCILHYRLYNINHKSNS